MFSNCTEANYVEYKGKQPRDAKALLSDDTDILLVRDCLKGVAAKAVKRVSK